ncbi:MAG: hypothetical protein GWN54_16085 [Gammaproteobacteria bacterium]|nr:hypothetical protein [Gammaproteobacteria bacterium]
MEKNNITSDADLTLLLDNEGLTLDEFRRLLLRSNVPQDVLQFEVARRLAVSGQEIADHYAANLESFRTRGEVTLREIVILSAGRGEAAAAERAAATVARLRAGEDFATVAAEISEAPSRENGGQVGPFQSGDLAPRLEESAFAMPVGEIGEAIATSYGYHILQVVTRTPSAIRPLEEVEAEVENTLRQEKYTRDLEVFLGRLWRENQVVLNPRYATGKLADGGPYATLEELLTGGDPLGPQEAGSGAANGESPRPQEGGGQ